MTRKFDCWYKGRDPEIQAKCVRGPIPNLLGTIEAESEKEALKRATARWECPPSDLEVIIVRIIHIKE